MKLLSLILVGLSVACGGGGSGEDNDASADSSVPNVEGTWTCSAGCNDVCIFESTLEVNQDGDEVSIESDLFSDMDGTINEDGNFDVETSDGEDWCIGSVDGDEAEVTCSVDDVICQEVTFERG
ncbi:MAG: hypothetical protein HY541_09340 [Deltaproteobacteria bacterium]|nr:hypothetical protein [Deltaproteobacteria bacterium]